MLFKRVKTIKGELSSMKYEMYKVGESIKKLRLKKNMSILELSYITNTSTAHLYQVENGTRKISLNLLYNLMTVMDTDANSLLGIEKEDETKKQDSIDEALSNLDESLQSDLKKLFQIMIDNVSQKKGEV